jgi:hypothetical protein
MMIHVKRDWLSEVESIIEWWAHDAWRYHVPTMVGGGEHIFRRLLSVAPFSQKGEQDFEGFSERHYGDSQIRETCRSLVGS